MAPGVGDGAGGVAGGGGGVQLWLRMAPGGGDGVGGVAGGAGGAGGGGASTSPLRQCRHPPAATFSAALPAAAQRAQGADGQEVKGQGVEPGQ